MRELIKIVERAQSPADIFVFAVNGLFDSVFAGKAACKLYAITEDTVEIDDLVTGKPEWNMMVFSALCDLADHYKMTLVIDYHPPSDDMEGYPAPRSIYQHFGFVLSDYKHMERAPIPQHA